jgi:hypothetical protein
MGPRWVLDTKIDRRLTVSRNVMSDSENETFESWELRLRCEAAPL